MKGKIKISLCTAFLLVMVFQFENKSMISRIHSNNLKTQDKVSVLIKNNHTFQIINNNKNKVMTTKSKYRFLRQLTYVSKTESVSDISIYMEECSYPMSFFDELMEDSTIIKDMYYETEGDNLLVKIRLQEYPSRKLCFRICL